ncbi:hypothetical protein E1286_47280, partial [Nonomuraea terrae]
MRLQVRPAGAVASRHFAYESLRRGCSASCSARGSRGSSRCHSPSSRSPSSRSPSSRSPSSRSPSSWCRSSCGWPSWHGATARRAPARPAPADDQCARGGLLRHLSWWLTVTLAMVAAPRRGGGAAVSWVAMGSRRHGRLGLASWSRNGGPVSVMVG